MAAFLDLPDDIFFLILLQFILGPQIEQLIKLDSVCKRLRQQCLCRALWIAALETLEYRPPFIASRSALLGLTAADLRREIIRAIKLDRSWLSESGPKKTSEELIPIIDYTEDYEYLRTLPQVDIIIAVYRDIGIQCWSISQKRVVWEYVAQEDKHAEQKRSKSLSMAYDVADDSSTVTIVLSWNTDHEWHASNFRVYQLVSGSFDCKLLYESTIMPSNSDIGEYMQIRNKYLALQYWKDNGLLIVNWMDRKYFYLKMKKAYHAIILTHDFLFLLHPEPSASGFRLVSIRLKDLVGSSSINPEDWPSYHVPEDIEDCGTYSQIVLPFEASEEDPTLEEVESRIAAGVSSWSRSPKTRLTVTLSELREIDLDGFGEYTVARNTIFDIDFKLGDDGKGAFTVLHKHHYACDMDLYNYPSLGIRSLVGEEDELPDTFSVAFDDNGDLCDRRNILEFFPADVDEQNISSIAIDPLGRMVAYQLSSETQAKCIGVIRFDL